jgi:hypothetical protein
MQGGALRSLKGDLLVWLADISNRIRYPLLIGSVEDALATICLLMCCFEVGLLGVSGSASSWPMVSADLVEKEAADEAPSGYAEVNSSRNFVCPCIKASSACVGCSLHLQAAFRA